MEAVKYFLWLNPYRSSAFFADHVVLTEGETEVALINRLITEGKVQNAPPGLYVLDCLGKYNIHRFMNLFNGLGIPHSVLHDDDDNKDEHAEINKLIQDSCRPRLTRCVKTIKGKLETMLELSNCGAPHRKAQHALYAYETGNIKKDNLDRFCQLLDELFPKS